jgi:hypothetical protein
MSKLCVAITTLTPLSANLIKILVNKTEFIFENGRLSFVDDSGRSVDKNLISFGMTNLGMIQALLKNNVQ